MESLPEGKKIILFDGVCDLCDDSVQFIIKHDAKDTLRFAESQSKTGQQILKHLGVDSSKIDSIVLYIPGEAYYIKAEAAMQIAKDLTSWHKIISYLSFTGSFGNFVYDYIAKNRYHWYGKKEACMIPTPELKAKFLEL